MRRLDRGMDAIVQSRRAASVQHVTTGANSPYDIATHEIFTRCRDRIYRAEPPLPPEKVAEFEHLYQAWFVFFTIPIREPDDMTAPQRAIWFRTQALQWQAYLDSREVQPEAPPSKWPAYIAAGLVVSALLAAVAGGSK